MSNSSAVWRFFDRIVDGCAALACAMLLLQVVSVSLDVLLRYFFNVSFAWITALNEWSLVYIAFLGAAWLEREGGHTRDDSMLDMLGPWAKKSSEWAGWVLGVGICLFLVWYGIKVTWNNYTKNVYDFFKLQSVPIFWIYMVIPFGSALWLVQLVRQIVQRRRSVPPTAVEL